MKYIKPSIELWRALAVSMIAESLKVISDDDKTVDGGSALAKEETTWDIWGEE